MKENLLLLRDLLEHQKIRFLNIWQLFLIKVYFDVLDDIVDKYNNTVHKTSKMKPVDVTDDSYAEYNEDFNKKDPKFKFGDHVRISKYKNIFLKDMLQICQKKFFLSVKSKIKFPGLMLLVT